MQLSVHLREHSGSLGNSSAHDIRHRTAATHNEFATTKGGCDALNLKPQLYARRTLHTYRVHSDISSANGTAATPVLTPSTLECMPTTVTSSSNRDDDGHRKKRIQIKLRPANTASCITHQASFNDSRVQPRQRTHPSPNAHTWNIPCPLPAITVGPATPAA